MYYELAVVRGNAIRARYEGRDDVRLWMETGDGDVAYITVGEIEGDRYYAIETDRGSVKLVPIYPYDSFEDYLTNT